MSVIGMPVRRREDYRFITGQGTYTDDINRPGQLHAYILRSPHANAKIAGIDTSAAASAPGVVSVYTGKDMAADGVGGLPCGWQIHSKDGSPMIEPPHPPLVVDRVRHVGDQVAVVIAETLAQARDAAELIQVDYVEEPAAIDPAAALQPGAPQVHGEAPGNLCYDWHLGDLAAVEAAFAKAGRVVKLDLTNNRLVPNAMEPRAAIGEFNRATGEHTLYTTSQNPHVIRLLMGAFVLHIPEAKLRVVADRAAGRPEASFLLERIVALAADELGMDPAELRRRNFIAKDAYPYQTPVALQYDSGDYFTTLELALKAADYQGFEARRRDAAARGKLRGLGIATYIEACGIAPSAVVGSLGARAGLFESAAVRVHPTGSVTVLTGSHSPGQGHETNFSQLVADTLGIPIESVEIVHGDTGKIPYGMGTYGSRSLAVGGTAIVKAMDKVVAKGRKIAAHLLEAAEADVEFKDGKFTVAGTDRSKTMAEVALTAYVPHNFPHEELEPGLDETAFYDPKNFTFPSGAHIAEVEIDPETGQVAVVNFTASDDFGRILNPMIVEGQVHGGLAQGIGQALLEGCVYDKETGQLLTGSYNDYTMPRAEDLPLFKLSTNVTPCTHNPLGVKGCGEAGAIGAPAAITNALVDALKPLGIRHLDMPATPERLWRLIQQHRSPLAAE